MSGQRSQLPQHALPRGLAGRLSYILMHFMHKEIYELVAQAADLRPDDILLDVACGDGYFLDKYASHVRGVAGLDLSEVGILRASKRLADRVTSGTAELVHADASRLPWPDAEFSIVTETGTLPVFPSPEGTIKEVHRVLRPGGKAVLCVPWNAEDGKDHSRYNAKYGMRIWSEADLRAMVRKAGFTTVDFAYAKGDGMPRMMLVTARKAA